MTSLDDQFAAVNAGDASAGIAGGLKRIPTDANSRLRALGAEPPLVDYIAWLWLGRPQAAWPAAVG